MKERWPPISKSSSIAPLPALENVPLYHLLGNTREYNVLNDILALNAIIFSAIYDHEEIR
jgi:hypothetical protein